MIYEVSIQIEPCDLDAFDADPRVATMPYPFLPGTNGTLFSVEADVETSTPRGAIEQVLADIDHVGLVALRADLRLISITEIAQYLDVSRETVRLWSTGARRTDFPPPYCQVGVSFVWAWADVSCWARKQGLVTDEARMPIPVVVIEEVNGRLAHNRSIRELAAVRR